MSGLSLRADDGREFLVQGRVATIGRAPVCEVRLDDSRVSATHARVRFGDGAWQYEDLRSTNGSVIRRGGQDHPVAPGRALALVVGDALLLGDTRSPVRLTVAVSGAPLLDGESPEATVLASRSAVLPQPLHLERSQLARLLDVFREAATAPGRTDAMLQHIGDFLFDLSPGATLLLLEATGVGADAEPLIYRRGDPAVSPGPSMPRGLRRRAVEQGEALLVADVMASSGDSVVELGLAGAMVAPLHVRDYTVGVLMLGGERFQETELELFAGIAHLVAALVENARTVRALADSEGRLRAEAERLRERIAPADGLISQSLPMREVLDQVDAVAGSDTTVLLLGETGTGKELLAQAIHRRSRRSKAAILSVNCGALASGTLESELFGHVKGAFTGAHRDKPGLFQVADGGTLFLDEVGETRPDVQVRLLRALQEGEILPVGAVRPALVDVRIVCATNRDLGEAVERGRFREDLYYRLSVFPIEVPPLRERRGDVVVLAQHFLAEAETRLGPRSAGFSPEALDLLDGWSWPGNVRELRNEVERAALLAPPEAPIQPEHLSPRLQAAPALPPVGPLKEALGRLEAAYLKKALSAHDGNRSATARVLGISRQALIAKIARYSLD